MFRSVVDYIFINNRLLLKIKNNTIESYSCALKVESYYIFINRQFFVEDLSKFSPLNVSVEIDKTEGQYLAVVEEDETSYLGKSTKPYFSWTCPHC